MKSSFFKWGPYLLWGEADEDSPGATQPDQIQAPKEIRSIAVFLKKITSGYLWIMDSAMVIACDRFAMRRLLSIARETGAGLVYSDFLLNGGDGPIAYPLNDYQEGSIRDNFHFGYFYLLSAAAVQTVLREYGAPPKDAFAALYDLRLKISIHHALVHVPEYLYTASIRKARPARSSGRKAEAQFAYVARENFARQKKMEKIAAGHLKRIGAYLPPRTKTADKNPTLSQWKASVIIPVRNRKKTIADALTSALSQKTNFAFNIIVVDNHSTDGTTGLLKKLASRHPHVHHLIPSSHGLGIGGCWNEAITSPFCGRYAVQLDSDDLYGSPQTLQKMVNALRKGPYAMVVGSYTLVNEKLKPIAPGLIDHREWTTANGHNNLLRINGMGAPRAFDTNVLGPIGFPNVSYGEDYAVALRLTREYKIGRIYESLYLCRRWKDNTDAALSVEKQNRNDYYKDTLRTLEIRARQSMNRRAGQNSVDGITRQENANPTDEETSSLPARKASARYPGKNKTSLSSLCEAFFESQKNSWPALAAACRDLAAAQTRDIPCGGYRITLQYNPARQASGSAAVDPESIRKRPCFLCAENRPPEQQGFLYRRRHLILCNPAPIFDRHFTVVGTSHTPQAIISSIDSLLRIARDASPEYMVFYNGPACGASAPDHLHFQMIPAESLPFLKATSGLPLIQQVSSVRIAAGSEFDRAVILLESDGLDDLKRQFVHIFKSTQQILATNIEPPMNVLCSYDGTGWRLTIFLRRKHRPDAFYAEGDKRIFVSPGAIDMAGVIVVPLLKDFERLDGDTLKSIYREVSLDENNLKKILDIL